MKKLFMAIMAVAAISLVGCKDKNTPAQGGGDEQKQDSTVTPPAGDEVAEGYVRLLIQVPDGEECHGIYMKGCVNGQWSGENTYVGLESGAVPAAEAIRFQRIAEKSDFFQADFKLGTDGLEGKVCQLYPNDGSWDGQAVKVSLIEDKTTLENAVAWKEGIGNEWPQLKIAAGTKPCVIALKIGGWQTSECVKANEAGQAMFTMISKVELPEGTQVGITGKHLDGKGDWDHENPIIMQKNGNQWMAIANVGANCVYKYVIKFADEPNWGDRHGHVIAGDKSDLIMPTNLAPVDEVDEWLKFDEHAKAEDFVPADHQFGLVGTFNGWAAPDHAFVYGDKDGDFFVAEAGAIEFAADAEFKIRENEDWTVNYGFGAFEILGDAENFVDNGGNVKVVAAASYAKVILKFKWNGANITDMSVEFVK